MNALEYVCSKCTRPSLKPSAHVFTPRDSETFDEYIAQFSEWSSVGGKGHFSGRELLTLKRLEEVAPVPKRSWWPRIIPALWIAEQARANFGPISIGNGYRPRDLNRRVGGARLSTHITFRALDLDLVESSPEIRREFYLWGASFFLEHGEALSMGIGFYAPWGGNRLHVDGGRTWGRPAAWKKKYAQPLLDSVR